MIWETEIQLNFKIGVCDCQENGYRRSLFGWLIIQEPFFGVSLSSGVRLYYVINHREAEISMWIDWSGDISSDSANDPTHRSTFEMRSESSGYVGIRSMSPTVNNSDIP